MTFGQRIRRIRRDRDATQGLLAADAGISTSHLSEIERDKAIPTAPVLERLADALGFTMHELWKGVGRCDPSGAEPPSALVEEVAALGTCDACDGTGARFGPNFTVIGLCPKCHPEGDFT